MYLYTSSQLVVVEDTTLDVDLRGGNVHVVAEDGTHRLNISGNPKLVATLLRDAAERIEFAEAMAASVS